MKVSPQEYNSLLNRLVDPNEFMHMLRIPEDEPVYEIDLNQRKISVPDFLSVEEDHNSEIIWFKTDRFYDEIDLYNSNCWIMYKNADKKEFFYAAPIMICLEEYGNEKILIPWAIGDSVAAKAGIIQFSFQFFKLSEDHLRFLYILNTQPATSKILHGLQVDPAAFLADGEQTEESTIPNREQLTLWLKNLTEAYNTLSNEYIQYWSSVD